MKKEKISVLKPNNGKKSKSKVNGNSIKSAGGKVQKKVASPRGPQKPKIVNIQKISNGDRVKDLKGVKSKHVGKSLTKSLVENKVQNGKNTNSTKDPLVVGKMAAIGKDGEDETRAQPKKKRKIHVAEKSSVAVKKEKKIKTAVEARMVEGSKKSKRKTKLGTKIANTGDLKLTKKHILKTIETILKLHQMKTESKKSLLPNESSPLYLQITCIKIAKTPRMHIRPYLPHTLVGPLDDVALFVPDLVKGRRQDYEKTVDHWETVFREKGVDCIKEIIPINRVKTEYGQFEMKRKLAASFDYFLTDGRISGHLTHLLSKTFLRRKNPPTPVKLDRDNLKEEFNFALHKTCMEIHKFGNTHTMQVGTVSMDKKKLLDNVWAACEALATEYPGGWDNIRAIQMKTPTSLAIPIFVNLAHKNSVKTPVVEPKRPRAYETAEGELTTIPGKTTVKVTPEGKITVKRERDEEDQVKEEVAEESDEVEEESDNED